MPDLSAYEIGLSTAAGLSGVLTAVAGRLVFRYLKGEREKHEERIRALEAALAVEAERVIVQVEYADGRREALVQQPVPDSAAARREAELALEDLERALRSGGEEQAAG
jgi:hypothetical protein